VRDILPLSKKFNADRCFCREVQLMTRCVSGFFVSFVFVLCTTVAAIEPDEILVIVNGDINSSMELGRYYCQRRNVPEDNILAISLGNIPADSISRDEYDKLIAGPVRDRLTSNKQGWAIKCLLTTYGIPYRVGPRGQLEGQQHRLKELEETAQQYDKKLADASSANEQQKIKKELSKVRAEIDRILGRETEASVDSELSMILSGPYELYRWQQNQLNKELKYPASLNLTTMVCRLDGPTPQIARGLIDKAISAERMGLKGVVYIDSRGIPDDKQPYSIAHFDQSLRDLAVLLRFRTKLEVKEERTAKLFEPNSCPRAVIYCGWYSLQKYVDAFDFVDGAIGYHIASLEAVDLRDPNSPQWCPAMLADGVTATVGAVAEPYLHTFPNPRDFFAELLDGKCLVEAFYLTQPFCSWQLVLIGDPLYTPFRPSHIASVPVDGL
jgi:uncharacterized protein (TIGR03790 family)